MQKAGMGLNTDFSNHKWGKRSRKALEYCERKARIVCEQRFFRWIVWRTRWWRCFEMRHSFLYFSSLVRISEFPYENFWSTCVQYGVRISSKASATAGWRVWWSTGAASKSFRSGWWNSARKKNSACPENWACHGLNLPTSVGKSTNLELFGTRWWSAS